MENRSHFQAILDYINSIFDISSNMITHDYDDFKNDVIDFINDLREKGVDFESETYKDNEEFKKLINEFVDDQIGLSMGWIIERTIVSQEIMEKAYGPYAMGVDHKPQKERDTTFTDKSFLNYFVETYVDNNLNTVDLDKYFFRHYNSKKEFNGVKYKLIDKLEIDLDSFDDSKSLYKLLYLIFKIEHDPDIVKTYIKSYTGSASKKKRINIFKFFANPTTENADRSLLGISSRNMYILRFLKSEAVKEIPIKYAYNVRNAFTAIVLEWENMLSSLFISQLNRPEYQWTNSDLENSVNLWRFYCEKIVNNCNNNHKSQDSLLETFYFRLWQHEHISIANDILLTIKKQENKSSPKINKAILNYIKSKNEIIPRKNLDSHIIKNRKLYTTLIFETDSPSSNNYRKFDSACKMVTKLIEMEDSNCVISNIGGILELKILVSINEYINLSKEEWINNSFYQHSTNEPKKLKSDISYGNNAFGINQIFWIQYINIAVRNYIFETKYQKSILNVDKCITMTMEKIFSTNNLRQMCLFHSKTIFAYTGLMQTHKTLTGYYNFINSLLGEYKFVKDNMFNDIFLLLFCRPSETDVISSFAKSILDMVKYMQVNKINEMPQLIPLEYRIPLLGCHYEFDLCFDIVIGINGINKSVNIIQLSECPLTGELFPI